MSSTADVFLKAILVGVGGTIVLDLYAFMMSRVLGAPVTNWAMVGRWFGNTAHGQFVQVAMSETTPVKGELAIGWIAHYAIGIGYGLLLLGLWGRDWLERPALLPPMILAWVLLAKCHEAEKHAGAFGFRPRHVCDRTATRQLLADFGVRESTKSFLVAMTEGSLIRRDVAVIGGGLPKVRLRLSLR